MAEAHDIPESATATTELWVQEVEKNRQHDVHPETLELPEGAPIPESQIGEDSVNLEIHITHPDHTSNSVTFHEGLFITRPSAPPSEAVSMPEVLQTSTSGTPAPTRTALLSQVLGNMNRNERPRSKDHEVRSSRMSRDTGSIRSAPGFTPLNYDAVDEHRERRFWRMSRRLHLRKHPPRPVARTLSSSSSWLSMDPERAKQRIKVLKVLQNQSQPDSGSDITEKLSPEQYSEAILRLAVDYKNQRHFEFNRFEHLSLIRILDCQHQLIAFDESFHYGDARMMDDTKRRKLNDAFKNYVSAIEDFEKLSKYNQPGLARSRETNKNLALKLREARYWDSPDSLNVFELTAPERSPCTDRIRLWLQRHIFASFLDQQGKEQRSLEMERNRKYQNRKAAALKDGLVAEDSKIILDQSAHNRYHVSPIVDNVARFLVALAGGVLLLVPMIVLVFVNHSLKGTLSSAVAFVFLFAVLISWGSSALNQEVVLATAAYGAILVVFVANTSPSIHN